MKTQKTKKYESSQANLEERQENHFNTVYLKDNQRVSEGPYLSAKYGNGFNNKAYISNMKSRLYKGIEDALKS